jgi:hypothetical protein
VATRTALTHVLVCAGTGEEWARTSVDQWRAQVGAIVAAVSDGDVRWLTLVAREGDGTAESRAATLATVCEAFGAQASGDRATHIAAGGLTVTVDACADGHRRFTDATRRLGDPARIDEARLAATLCAPAPDEPDLVVVLGEATRLPASLTWELGYSELVFLDVPWLACNAEHLGLAIDDFRRRSRRFGDVD